MHVSTRNAAALDMGFHAYTEQRLAQWEEVAALGDSPNWGRAYHQRLRDVYRHIIPPGQRVLELGCGDADLLAAVQPSEGVGVDFSPLYIARTRQRHPELTLIEADAHTFEYDGVFDYKILSGLVNDLWDVQRVLENVARMCSAQTRIIVDSYSRVWELPLNLTQKLKLSKPRLYQNWLTSPDLMNLLNLAGFETIRRGQEILFPLPVPLLNPLLNRYAAKLPLLSELALVNVYVARLRQEQVLETKPIVSVIVPARNEAGNIDHIFERVPEMGAGTELVFVEGHSRDNTYEVIEQMIAAHPERYTQLHRQTGVGKGDAVRLGFEKARGSILMILDADLTVPPEDLPRFYQALVKR